MDKVSMKAAVFEELRRVLTGIKKTSLAGRDIDFARIAHTSIKEGYFDGKAIQRVIFYLRGQGCKWALSENGGCFMCGHYRGTSMGRKISPSYFINQFKAEFFKYDFQHYPMICIYNAGSFLNEEEMPAIARREILQVVANNPYVKVVILESRPEFISQEIVKEIEATLAGKRVEIGVGLELENDYFRGICINKGFTFNEYESCAKIVSKSDLHLLTYVTVRPLFLTTEESIDQAITTTQRAVEVGSEIISFEPTSLQEGTLVEYFFNAGLYSLPWGWEIIEIMKAVNHLTAEIRIGGFEFFPIPKEHIHNCTFCNKLLYEAIAQYNATKNSQPLFSLECNCKQRWEADIEREKNIETDLIFRVYEMLELG